jgi:hypothetical protein
VAASFLGPLALALALAACGTVELTPAAIPRADAPDEIRSHAVATWREAVALANEFLASDWRQTLPAGRYELDDEQGMRFVTPLGTWPIAVRCNRYGDLCVFFGFAAQEREYGFVIGENGPQRDRLVDNSLFCFQDGMRKNAQYVADLILHETTHVVWREGTVGFWNGVAYYLEAVFLFRTNDHSAERRPRSTGEEFLWFCQVREYGDVAESAIRPLLQSHQQEPRKLCEHGPFGEAPPEAPIAPATPPTAAPTTPPTASPTSH